MKCPNCNSKMKITNLQNELLYTCTKCDTEFVCPIIPEIYNDDKKYKLYINTNNINKENIGFVSKISGLNYIQIKKLGENYNLFICEDYASNIKKLVDELKSRNIIFTINPFYKYK